MAVAAQELETTRRQRFVDVKVTAEKKLLKMHSLKEHMELTHGKLQLKLTASKQYSNMPLPSHSLAFLQKKITDIGNSRTAVVAQACNYVLRKSSARALYMNQARVMIRCYWI